MKYFKLWLAFLKISWMAEAEYRANLVIRIFADCVWYVSQLSIFEVLFYHAPHIAGWDIHSMRVFMGILFIVDVTYMILFHDNFEKSSNLVRTGELDFILAKPVNSQFMFSFRKVNPVYLINLGIVSSYTAWALHALPVQPHPLQYAQTLMLMICGLGVLYSMRFFFAALAVIFTNASSLTYVWYQFYRLGMRPHSLYPVWLRWIVILILPVGLIVSVPATNLVHGLRSPLLWIAPAIAVTLVYLSTIYWRYVLKFYASASS